MLEAWPHNLWWHVYGPEARHSWPPAPVERRAAGVGRLQMRRKTPMVTQSSQKERVPLALRDALWLLATAHTWVRLYSAVVGKRILEQKACGIDLA